MASGQQYDLEKLLLSQNREQLDDLLRSEYEKSDPDYALIERILAVLEASTEEFNSKPALTFDEFLKTRCDEPLYDPEFDDEDSPAEDNIIALDSRAYPVEDDDTSVQPKHIVHFHRKWSKVLIAAALVVTLMVAGSGIAYASGYNIWGAIVQWSKDYLSFKEENRNIIGTELDEELYDEIESALGDSFDNNMLIPTYIPAGYSLINVDVFQTEYTNQVSIVFSNESSQIGIVYYFEDALSSQLYPKNNEQPREYSSNGIDYTLIKNEKQYIAMSSNMGIVTSIYGVEKEGELLKIIDSMK